MTMLTQFFVSDLPRRVGDTYEFNSEDAHHAVRVLRINAGEVIRLSDGNGAWSDVKVTAVLKKSLEVVVENTGYEDQQAIEITVVQALPKGDHLKEAVELLTEVGVDTIVPWAASRSIGRADKGIEKIVITAREASKQSRRLYIPQIAQVASTADVVALIEEHELALVFHEGAEKKLSDRIRTKNVGSVLIIIGPEGGIAPMELEAFENAGAKIALMGHTVLRSAHAGFAAVSAVNALLKTW